MRFILKRIKFRITSIYNISQITSLLFLLLAGQQIQADVNAEQQQAIVIIGDSLSAAHGIPLASSWAELLQRKLDSSGYQYRVINTSVSGDTSYTAVNKSAKILKRYQPEICLLAIGANDGLQGLSLKSLKQNLKSLVEMCQQYTRKILLFEMKLPLNYGKSFVERFAAVYQTVATEKSVTLVPFFMESFATNLDLFLADQIHPNSQAQPILLEKIWPYLKPYLKIVKTEK